MTHHPKIYSILCNYLYKTVRRRIVHKREKRDASADMPEIANATKLPGRSSILGDPLQAAGIAYNAANQWCLASQGRICVHKEKVDWW